MRSILVSCAAALATLMAFGTMPAKAEYPERPVTLVVPWPPGGATDSLGRIIAQRLAQRLGQSVIVENRPGAGGNIGTTSFVRETADGHTLLMATSSTNAANPHLYGNLGFDPLEDFAPIAFVASIPNLLEVPAASPFTTAAELADYAKTNPGELYYASGGVGSSQHLAGSMLNHLLETDIDHIPYQGSGPAVTDLLAGHVDMMLDTGSLSLVQSGQLRALAVAATERLPTLPDVPTMEEAGLPAMEASAWYAIVAPRGTPDEIRHRLHDEVTAVLEEDDVRERLLDMGAFLRDPLSPDELGEFFRSEIDRYQEIVSISGASID